MWIKKIIKKYLISLSSQLGLDNKDEYVLWGGVRWNQETSKRLRNPACLEKYGYKFYSQNDEDGILEEIFRRIGTTNKTFIEFGVQDGLESNTHLLLFQQWHGLWIEASKESYQSLCIKFRNAIQSKRLQVMNKFVTKDNINDLFASAGMQGEIDLLSIDIDGNDYHIWENVKIVKPRVVVIEYNGKFPPHIDWTMAYNEKYVWDQSDCHGASLKAMERLGTKKGYQLVGTNLNGVNAFFVKKELAGDKFILPATAENLYNPLKLNMHHKNGHPGRACLYNQTKNHS